jgi:hypothetical protein
MEVLVRQGWEVSSLRNDLEWAMLMGALVSMGTGAVEMTKLVRDQRIAMAVDRVIVAIDVELALVHRVLEVPDA